jgi:DGQHR domain-containing protein
MADRYQLRFPALEIQQSEGTTLYAFAADGKQIPLFAAVSRVGRDSDSSITGYQRPEVVAHIAAIRHYLESEQPMIPNSIVIAFDERVKFVPARAKSPTVYSRPGTLVIPVDERHTDAEKPGWIVDGQQRTAAIRDARIDEFPICITAFVTANAEDQRAQFILVNSTKPLPKGLIYELLPSTNGALPHALQRKRFPSYLLDRLNYDADSPLEGLIRTPTTPDGIVKDNSVLRMLENSLYDGVLYHYRDPDTGEGNTDSMLHVLKDFWAAVRDTFPDAWGLPSRRSRLMHGVGIVSLGFVMDAIADEHLPATSPRVDEFAAGLARLAPACRWISGYWQFANDHLRRWNDMQNTPRDIQLLTDHLLSEYRQASRSKSKDGRPTR